MVDISVKSDVKQATRQLRGIQRRAIPKATVRALNRTAQQAERTALREVSQRMGLAQKRVKRGVDRSKANRFRMVAVIRATGRRLNIFSFAGRVLKRGGVTASPWKKRRKFKGVFTIPGRFTGKEVAVLHQGGGRLRSVHGPGVASEFRRALPAIRRTIADRWRKNFAQDLRYYLSRLR